VREHSEDGRVDIRLSEKIPVNRVYPSGSLRHGRKGLLMTTFTRVDRRDADCVTIVFWSKEGLPHCRILGPTKLIFGQKFELDSPLEGSSFVSLTLSVGMQFAKDVAVPLVIADPEGLWNHSWGTLSDRNVNQVQPSQ
jgi:hypothetical protein